MPTHDNQRPKEYPVSPASLFAAIARESPERLRITAWCPKCGRHTEQVFMRDNGHDEDYLCVFGQHIHSIRVR